MNYPREERRKKNRLNFRIYSDPERGVRAFWETFMHLTDAMPDWAELATLAVTCVCSISFCIFLFIEQAHAQQHTQDLSNIQVQQAIIGQQVVSNVAEMAELKKDVQYNRDRNTMLADEVATMRGIGIGLSFMLGLLQAVQIILQVKTKVVKP